MRIYFLLLFFLFVSISNLSWGKEISAPPIDRLLRITENGDFNKLKRLPYAISQTPARQAMTLSWADTTAPKALKSKIQARMWELGVGASYVLHAQKNLGGVSLNTAEFSLFGEISLLQALFVQMHLGWVSLNSQANINFGGLGGQQTIEKSENRIMLGFQPGLRLPIPIGKFSYIGPSLAYRLDIYDSGSFVDGPKTSYPLFGIAVKIAPIAVNISINPDPDNKIVQLSACYIFQLSK